MECGFTIDGETGLCRVHLAEQEEVPVYRIHYLVRAGRLEAIDGTRRIDCHRNWTSRSLINVGSILQAQNEGWFEPRPKGQRGIRVI